MTDDLESDDFLSPKNFRNNKRNRERLAILERRHDHLADRVENDPSLTFDAAECAALYWAIMVLRKVINSSALAPSTAVAPSTEEAKQ